MKRKHSLKTKQYPRNKCPQIKLPWKTRIQEQNLQTTPHKQYVDSTREETAGKARIANIATPSDATTCCEMANALLKQNANFIILKCVFLP